MIENEKENIKEKFSYLYEIAPDFQKRTRLTVKNVRSVPKESATHVGMDVMTTKSLMGQYFVEFANNSSIHGLNHLVARHRHPLERFLVAIFILAALASLIFVSIISWYRYEYDAISLHWNHEYKLFRLVKPSLIICPINVIQDSNFPETFKRYGIEDTPNARAFFHFLSNATYETMINTPDYNDAPPGLWLRILSDLKKEFFYKTTFSDQGIWIATENGICVSIGNLVLQYASLQNLISNNWTVVPLAKYPPDLQNFEVDNKNINDFNYIPSYTYNEDHGKTESVTTDAEVTLSILDPMDSYNYGKTKHHLQILDIQNVVLRILQTDSTKSIYKLPIHRRKCGLPSDNGLELWPIYTYQMCMTECRSHIIKKKCGCYPHFLRHIPDIPICNAAQLRCIGRLQQSELLNVKTSSCNCLINCNKVSYLSEETKLTRFKTVSPINTTSFIMTISFSKGKFKRKEWYTFGDFLTSIGGAAGLFLGCSVLSFVEILYYGTLHLYIYVRYHKSNKM
ncbi:pickpocket protein 19-like [Vespula squamosa]|uniref:Pickpocket protein 19-like n=1 Tax=Vespula squamosa TaxID=30214 RepID=A0ABD2ANP0_VESSQ